MTFALVAEISPAGKQGCGHAAETRPVQWSPCSAAVALSLLPHQHSPTLHCRAEIL